jgi:hypothetical protein
MSFTLGTVTGAPQVGLTSPTYTCTADVAPGPNGKQFAVTALGGTQSGVDVHSVSKPFTITYWRPLLWKYLGKANPITGVIANVPMNTSKIVTRKGVIPLAGQPSVNFTITTVMDVPAGADIADSPELKAALSAHFGAVWGQSSGIGDSILTGVM